MQDFSNAIRAMAVASILAAAALCGCSRSGASSEAAVSKNTDWVKQQFLDLEKKHTPEGELFAALRKSEPELYARFIEVVGGEISAGKSFFDAGAAARPLYLTRFKELSATTDDKTANELLAFAREQMASAQEIDPLLCVNLARGAADQRVTQLPRDITNRELELMRRVLESGDQHGAVASAEEVQTWATGYVSQHPETTEGLQMMNLPVPTREQGRAICGANLQVLDGLLAEEPARRARLFRGSLAGS